MHLSNWINSQHKRTIDAFCKEIRKCNTGKLCLSQTKYRHHTNFDDWVTETATPILVSRSACTAARAQVNEQNKILPPGKCCMKLVASRWPYLNSDDAFINKFKLYHVTIGRSIEAMFSKRIAYESYESWLTIVYNGWLHPLIVVTRLGKVGMYLAKCFT